MNNSRLDEDLQRLGKPDLPADFNARVWSKIQAQERRMAAGRSASVWTFLRPQWVTAAFALAILAGWFLGRITTGAITGPDESRLAAAVTGEVIDLACYFDNGASGPEHAACARMCIASGLPVGLKARDGTIYVLIGKQPPPSMLPGAKHETLNAALAPYAAKVVTVSGTVVRKNNMNVIENAELRTREAFWEQPQDWMTN